MKNYVNFGKNLTKKDSFGIFNFNIPVKNFFFYHTNQRVEIRTHRYRQ